MPPRQREVLQRLLACRTPALGGALYYCPDCDHRHFSYHSCNDRHCPQCGGLDTQQWLADNAALLLPVDYFLVTFTVPEGLRRWIRSHPETGYDLLLAASSHALQDLAQNPRRLGATLGMLGVLHTWTRTLEYHPHVHYLVPGGGLSLDQRQWVSSRPNFLLPVKGIRVANPDWPFEREPWQNVRDANEIAHKTSLDCRRESRTDRCLPA